MAAVYANSELLFGRFEELVLYVHKMQKRARMDDVTLIRRGYEQPFVDFEPHTTPYAKDSRGQPCLRGHRAIEQHIMR